MEKYVVEHSGPLKGTVKIDGSKNSVLPILAATLLTDKACIIHDVPTLSDVSLMEQILNNFGTKTNWDKNSKTMTLETNKIFECETDYGLVSRMRASFLIMGPVLSRMGKIKIPLPGGCAIGSRPVDLHLKGFSALGAEITQEHGYVTATAKKLVGNRVYLDFPSVGATENIMMVATLAEGQTVIENCAVEPEIVDLASFLNSMGANIKGAGTDTIRINGVTSLGSCEHTVVPDRIEAGTFMIAAAITRGDVIIENIVCDHLKPVIAKLEETDTIISEVENGIRVSCGGLKRHKSIQLKTLPHPGFPTDMQAQFMSLLSVAEGTSIVTETVFENRFMHVGELKRLGANITIEGRSAVIEGVEGLTGSQVKSTDLRSGAALIIAGLRAEGITEISDIYHVERGYDNIHGKLVSLGAKIRKICEE